MCLEWCVMSSDSESPLVLQLSSLHHQKIRNYISTYILNVTMEYKVCSGKGMMIEQ